MSPLKVTFEINGPIVMPVRPLHLDALLAYIYTQSRLFMLEAPYTQDDILALADDLPLARTGEGENWVYKASALQPSGFMEHSSRCFTTRHSADNIATAMAEQTIVNKRDKLPHPHMSHKGKVDLTRGHVRNSLLYHPVTMVDNMEAFCIGDKDAIIDSFSSGHITHLGKMRRMGFGLIKSISVVDDTDAEKHWKKRVRPFEESGDIPVSSPLRPPYWLKEKEHLCFVPSNLI